MGGGGGGTWDVTVEGASEGIIGYFEDAVFCLRLFFSTSFF
jgi:hypothetical protein